MAMSMVIINRPLPPLALLLLLMIIGAFMRCLRTSSSATLPRDRTAIMGFKESVVDPQGMLANWDGDPCSENWNYISCSDATDNKTILQISLSNLQLGGEIPDALQDLKDLKTLDLGNNNFEGLIPVWLANLTHLVALDLQSNQLSGKIPKELGQLRSLVFLRLTNNSLEGSIPKELGDLSSLKIFACESNLLSGHIPETFSNMTSISQLHMDNNRLTGPIPSGLCQFSNLIYMFLNDNRLYGTLTEDLGSCSNLQKLNLDNNLLTGPIPETFGLLTNLTDLRMHNNCLHGSIPTSFSNLIYLRVLDLGCNRLQGNIPTELGDLESLIRLDLQENQLSGSIPSTFTDLFNIEIINLASNKLAGVLPDLGLNNNLVLLDVEDNNVIGPIPPSLAKKDLDFLAYDNPLCLEMENNTTNACNSHLYNNSHIQQICNCFPGMISRPFNTVQRSSEACECVAPLIIDLFFPRILFPRCTKEMQVRLAVNLACDLYLDTRQVIIKSSSQNGTGTDISFYIVPITGMILSNPTLERIKEKLYAPHFSAVWFYGEFGWFDYIVLHFIIPPPQDSYCLNLTQTSSISMRHKPTMSIIATCIVGGAGLVFIIIGIISLLSRRHWGNQGLHHVYQSSHNLVPFYTIKGHSSPSLSLNVRAKTEQHAPFLKIFTVEELSLAAGNFCSENLIGTGGFGSVYKGTLSDGTNVAIKKISGLSKQGEEEFQNEVQMIAHRLHNPYLLHLLGYCSQQDERMLVYNLMPRGSLLDYLKGGSNEHPIAILDWNTRIQVALDSAAGLRCLHELDPPVVHRDVKASNILLDANFNAKVADFGLSKLYPTSDSSHVTTRVMGTFGYLAPDYSITGKLTVKSDVYSFGVVLTELISGQHALVLSNERKTEFLIPWAKPLLKDKTKQKLVVDPNLEGAYPPKGLELMSALILACLELDPDRRPDMITIQNVLRHISRLPFHSETVETQRKALLSSSHSGKSRLTYDIQHQEGSPSFSKDDTLNAETFGDIRSNYEEPIQIQRIGMAAFEEI